MSAPPEQEQYEAHVGRIARGAGISSFGQVIGRVANYGTQVTLARMYGPAVLGLYVLGTTVVQIANILSQFGMSNGLVRYVAHYQSQGDVRRVRGTILMVLWTSLALSLMISCAMFFSAGFLAHRVFHEESLATVLRVFSISLPFLTVMNLALWATQGFQTVKYATYVQQIQQPLLNLVLIVAFYLLGAQILGVVTAYIISMVASAALSIYYLKRVFPKLLDRNTPPRFEPRALFNASAPMVIATFAQNMNSWIVVTMLGAFASAGEVGVFNAAVRTAALSALVLGAFANIFAPIVSSLYGRGEMENLDRLYRDVSRWVFTGSLMIFLITVLLSRDIMAVFGPKFIGGWIVLVVVAVGQLVNSSTGPGGRVLAMTGHQRVVMLASVVSAAATFILGIVLIPGYGIMGAGVAAATGLFLSNIVGLLLVRRLVGLWPYDRSYLKPIAIGTLSAAAAYLVKLALPFSAGIPTVLIIAPFFLACFAALVLVFGLSQSDRQLLASLWKAVSKRMPVSRPEDAGR